MCVRLYASVRYGFDEGLLIMIVTMRITIQFNSLVWGISKRYRYERTKQQTKIVHSLEECGSEMENDRYGPNEIPLIEHIIWQHICCVSSNRIFIWQFG